MGLLGTAPVSPAGAAALARVAQVILTAGGSVLLPEGDALLVMADFRAGLPGPDALRATLAYGQPVTVRGLHLVQTDSDHWVENLAGLGACGVQVFLGLVADTPQQGHPMLPVLQVAERGVLPVAAEGDVDLMLTGEAGTDAAALLRLLADTLQGACTPVAAAGGFTDFQLSRGLLGVST